MQFKINVNDNGGSVVSNVPIEGLTDEQFQNLRIALNDEITRRAQERQKRADVLTGIICRLYKQAEDEGFRLVYNGEDFEYSDFWIEG